MDDATLKLDLIRWLTQIQDKSLLMKIQLLKDGMENEPELSEEQLFELDQRLIKYEAGQMEFSSWEDVKDRLKSRGSNEQ